MSVGGINVKPTLRMTHIGKRKTPNRIKEVHTNIQCPNPECARILRIVYPSKQVGDMHRALKKSFSEGLKALQSIHPKVYYIDPEKLQKDGL